MARALKVYGWNPYGQGIRHIVAAPTKKAVGELVGVGIRSQALFCLTETANPVEMEVALAHPGEIFYCGHHFSAKSVDDWTKDES